MNNDPYYWSRDIMNFNAQQQALGRGKGMDPQALSGLIAANFSAQQEDMMNQQKIKLAKDQQAFNAYQTNVQNSMQQQQQASQERSGTYSSAANLAINTPLIYATGKAAGLWGTASSAPGVVGGTEAALQGPVAPAAISGVSGGQAVATGAGTAAQAETAAAASEGVGLGTTALGVGAAGLGGYVGYEAGSHLIHGKYSEAAGVAGSIAAGAAIGSVVPGIGTAIGAVVGGVVGLVTSGSIICTELNRQGYIDDSMLRVSTAYVVKYGNAEAYLGYLIFATPIVERMKKSKLVTLMALPYGKTMCRECASRIRPDKYKSTWFSRMTYKVSEKVFKVIYRRSKYASMEACNG